MGCRSEIPSPFMYYPAGTVFVAHEGGVSEDDPVRRGYIGRSAAVVGLTEDVVMVRIEGVAGGLAFGRDQGTLLVPPTEQLQAG